MACRMQAATFTRMMVEENRGLTFLGEMKHDPLEPFSLAAVEDGEAKLNRKAIQSLVDHAEEARPIIRNLLRWAKEHGAK